MGCLISAIIIVALEATEFLVIAGLYWLICFGFGLMFTWKIAIAVWAIFSILQSIFKPYKIKE